MKNKYPHIFEPITVRRMTVKNRIVMTPMGTNYGEQNGEMSFLHINYYEQRAKGGTGLIIVENASVDSPQGSNGTTQLRIDLDNYIPRLFKLCESVHKHGACIAIQLNHAGASAMSSRIGMQPVSASDVPSKAGGEIPRPLEKDEIMHIVKKYGEAAKRAQICGFDAVEIHAGHSYLISQFLSPITNKRTDEFGGSAENRARFAKLVIEEVRKQVGPCHPRRTVQIAGRRTLPGGGRHPAAAPHTGTPARRPPARRPPRATAAPARRPPRTWHGVWVSTAREESSAGGGNRTKSGKDLDFRRKTPILQHKIFAGLRCRSVRKHTRTKR